VLLITFRIRQRSLAEQHQKFLQRRYSLAAINATATVAHHDQALVVGEWELDGYPPTPLPGLSSSWAHIVDSRLSLVFRNSITAK